VRKGNWAQQNKSDEHPGHNKNLNKKGKHIVELRTYWSIIWRRIWVVALVVGIIAIYVGYQYYHLRKTPGALKAYSSSTTIQIGLQPTTNGELNSTNYITVSESLADSMVTGPVLTSHEFATAISNQIAQDTSLIQQRYGTNPDLGDWQNATAIGQALSASHVHNFVTIDTNWSTPAGAWEIANAVGEVSVAKIDNYLTLAIKNNAIQKSTGNNVPPVVAARVITPASDSITVFGSSSNKVSLYLLMLLVALAIGVALTFLLDYLDDRIRNKDEVTQLLGIPIYTVLPRAPTPGRSRLPVPHK
jgi:capsular polysaccharide biosynthesis protein